MTLSAYCVSRLSQEHGTPISFGVRRGRPQLPGVGTSNSPDRASADPSWAPKLHALAGLHVEVWKRWGILAGDRVPVDRRSPRSLRISVRTMALANPLWGSTEG